MKIIFLIISTLLAITPSWAIDFRTDVPESLQKVEESYRLKAKKLCEDLIKTHVENISSLEKKCLAQGDSSTAEILSAYKAQLRENDFDFLDRNNINEFHSFEGKEWVGTISTDANRILRINDNMKIERRNLDSSNESFRQEESWIDKKASNQEILVIRGYSTMVWILEDYDKLINATNFENSGSYISAERLSLYSHDGVIVHGNDIRKEFFRGKFELIGICRKKVYSLSEKYRDFAKSIIRKKLASGDMEQAKKIGEFIQTIPCPKKVKQKSMGVPYGDLLGDWTPHYSTNMNIQRGRDIISIYSTGKAEMFEYSQEWSQGRRIYVLRKKSKNISYNYVRSSAMQSIHQFDGKSNMIHYFCNVNGFLWCIVKDSDHKFTVNAYRKDFK